MPLPMARGTLSRPRQRRAERARKDGTPPWTPDGAPPPASAFSAVPVENCRWTYDNHWYTLVLSAMLRA